MKKTSHAKKPLHHKEPRYSASIDLVIRHRALIDSLTGSHRHPIQPFDWNSFSQSDAPAQPYPDDTHARRARQRLLNYEPTLLDMLFNRTQARRDRLRNDLHLARLTDEQDFQQVLEAYNHSLDDWQEQQRLAAGIAINSPEAYLDAWQRFDPFHDWPELDHGETQIRFNRHSACVDMPTRPLTDIPKFSILLENEKLVKKDLSPLAVYKLHKQYASSLLLRTAHYLLTLLPIDTVTVNLRYPVIPSDLSTTFPDLGASNEFTLLAATIDKTTLESIDLAQPDAGIILEYFPHNKRFSAIFGLQPVPSLNLS